MVLDWKGTEFDAIASEQTLSFGPVIERFINNDDPKLGDNLIDFDTGAVASLPEDVVEKAAYRRIVYKLDETGEIRCHE